MQRILVAVLGIALAFPLAGYAQTGASADSAEPFKVGTFVTGNTQTIGVVLRDSLVVDVVQANAALEKTRSFPARGMPSEMVGLHRRLRERPEGPHLRHRQRTGAGQGARRQPPAYVRKLAEVRTLAPIPRPRRS